MARPTLIRFGWELDSIAGQKQIPHGGSLPGFRSQFARFVDDKLSVIVLTNGDNADVAQLILVLMRDGKEVRRIKRIN